MVNPIASLYQSWSQFFLFVSFLELLSHDHFLLFGGHGGSFDHLGVGRVILIFWNFISESSNVLGDLIELLDAEPHNSFKAPKYVCVDLTAIEHDLHDLIITEQLCLLLCIHLLTSLAFDLLCEESKHNDSEHLIHALSVAKLIVVFRPQVEHVH